MQPSTGDGTVLPTICNGMVGCSLDVPSSKQLGKGIPQLRHKLSATIGSDLRRHAKTNNPSLDKSSSNGVSSAI